MGCADASKVLGSGFDSEIPPGVTNSMESGLVGCVWGSEKSKSLPCSSNPSWGGRIGWGDKNDRRRLGSADGAAWAGTRRGEGTVWEMGGDGFSWPGEAAAVAWSPPRPAARPLWKKGGAVVGERRKVAGGCEETEGNDGSRGTAKRSIRGSRRNREG